VRALDPGRRPPSWWHRKVFAKLEINSRTKLARALPPPERGAALLS
jgi:hypothetical protein